MHGAGATRPRVAVGAGAPRLSEIALSLGVGIGRWASASLATFAALGLALAMVLERVAPGHDPSLWAWDLRFLPTHARMALRLSGVGAFAWAAWGRARVPQLRPLAIALIGVFGIVAMKDVATTLGLHLGGALPGAIRWPFSAWVALACAFVGARAWRRAAPATRAVATERNSGVRRIRAVGSLGLGLVFWAALFARGQMHCFGGTDYRGDPFDAPADGIVVFGARAYANGAPSPALRYRVERALELYRAGFASRLFLSGGPGEGDFHEVDVMSSILQQYGVPEAALIRDEGGWSTQLTVDHAARHFGPRAELLAVSQGFHLPRIELTFARAGLDVRTVPARDSRYPWVRMRNANRETLALGWYALKPLLGR
jgi:vancomycin permeability regulator SanA/uncharacterized protein YjeT (DUF2065 family)